MPSSGTIYAPISGIVTTIARTRHAISFKNEEAEILVHVGLDTVNLDGKGFTTFVKEGESARQGQPVMEADIAYIESKNLNPIVITIRLSS